MALPRAVIRVLAFIAALGGVALLYQLAFTPTAEGVWDASSWADRRASKSLYDFGKEDNPNGVVWDANNPAPHQVADRTSGTGWSLFGGGSKAGSKPPGPGQREPNTPRPLPRVNTTRPRTNFGTSRVVIPNTNPEEYEEASLPDLDQAFKHLEPMLRAVKERHMSIPREHELWEPLFPPFLTDDLQERFWHLREEWDEETQTWKHTGERRYMLVTICRQVAGEFILVHLIPPFRATWLTGWIRDAGGLVCDMDSIGRLSWSRDTTLFAPRR
jgi:hypothetical protein